MRVKKRLYITMWEGAPDAWFHDRRALIQRLEELNTDEAESTQVFAVFNERGPGQDITKFLAGLVSKLYEFGAGDEPDDYLRNFPAFVLVNYREELIDIFNNAADPNGIALPSFLVNRSRKSIEAALEKEFKALDGETRP